MGNNQDKVAVISGGTKGIGRAICEKFLAEGFRVFTSARSIDHNFKHQNLNQFKADLSNKKEVRDFSDWILDQTSSIDVLVNNVGVFLPGKISEEHEDAFEIQINTNLASTYHLTRNCLSALKSPQSGYIFNICSTASITPYINGGSYCISKYAQYGLTKVLREEMKEFNIRVSAVLPGATYTNSWSESDLPIDRFIKPKSIAQLIWTAYQLDDNSVMEEILIRPMDGDI
ncbi:MAG: SDR family oxidoreductase [Bacteroidia bacterium]|nr:SDR family oxidoreductase [Bacteroidia bacterium]NNJ56289.1 SDR family oxidoreductase [Bacteroidia bacterium]